MKKEIVKILNRYFMCGPAGLNAEYDSAYSAQDAIDAIAKIVNYDEV